MSLFTRSFPRWLPIAVALTLVIGISYLFAQQVYRMSANDPQIAVARDTAAALADGTSPDMLVSAVKVDPSQSLAPFVMILDASGRVVASSMTLGDATATPPAGVLASAKTSGENRVTWQPRADARIAAVVVPVESDAGGFVVAGRSLQAVEGRIDQLTQLAGLGWIASLVLTFGSVLLADWMTDRRAA